MRSGRGMEKREIISIKIIFVNGTGGRFGGMNDKSVIEGHVCIIY